MLTERSKVPSEAKKRYFFPAKNPVDARREVVNGRMTGMAGMAERQKEWQNGRIYFRSGWADKSELLSS